MLGGKNKQRRQPLGYTIVEVMIVLAVSGMMFLIAANFISGKQERAAFAQGSNDMSSKLQQIVSDVTDGHYSDVPVSCFQFSGSLIATTTNTGNQGQTASCEFLGKIIRFYDPLGGSTRDHFSVYSVVADRGITNFPDSLVASVSGLTAQSTISQGLYAKKVTVVDTSGAQHTSNYNVGFLQGVGNIGGVGVYLSGAQQAVQLVYADTTSGSEAQISGTTIQKAKSATICMTDDTRYADIFIGGPTQSQQTSSSNNNQLNISVQQLGTTSC